MAVFTMEIIGFGDLPITPVFAPSVEFRRAQNSQVHAQVDTWSVSGVLIVENNDPNTLKTKRNNILAAMRGQNNHVKFKKDASTFEEISPSTHVHGAQFQNFNVEDTGRGGEWVATIHYTFEVVGEKPVDIPGVVDAEQTSDTVEEEDGKTTITTTVTARGPGAFAFVLGQKPADSKRSSIFQSTQGDTVTGRFEVSGSASTAVSVEENVEIAPGIFPMEMVSPSRSDTPIPLYGSREATRLSISGTITHPPDQNVAAPIPEELSRFFASAPSFGRGTRFKHTELSVTTTYRLEFLLPESPDIGEFLKERGEIKLEDYLSDSPNGVNILEPD